MLRIEEDLHETRETPAARAASRTRLRGSSESDSTSLCQFRATARARWTCRSRFAPERPLGRERREQVRSATSGSGEV